MVDNGQGPIPSIPRSGPNYFRQLNLARIRRKPKDAVQSLL